MILHKNLYYLCGSPSTVRAEHVARQTIQEIHADYFGGNLLVNIHLEESEGNEKTLKWILGEEAVKSEKWNWLRIVPNGRLWYKLCSTYRFSYHRLGL
jgi:hypothetical protein